ncbi:helix-turn-helix domain-containing protein [Mycolicibacterium mucogenicum]|uniref:helix-turn-helix domain-containing protein n=1 Tax=Mycolicibacterium mucogenicum TaxID=56689 RepID=UPI00226A0F72|nr:helix-turn-helix domain-containing protein [Mycolicibacterium mucogenicum]MCX8557218.1 helix-turn-helix domain-containing protein [Mycolicibacterium mucogenicum]
MAPSSDDDATSAKRANAALSRALHAKGLSQRRLAERIGIHEKTVRRWVTDADWNVQPENARAAAAVLGCTPHDLWPSQFPAEQPASRPAASPAATFTPTFYATRTHVPITVWQNHFAHAQESIDILVFAATFLFDTLDGFTTTLVDAAQRGAQVRFLVGDPGADIMILRGEEEGIGDSVVARSRNSVELLTPHLHTPGVQVRSHRTTLYTSIFRVDDDMIINFHVYGSPGRNNPVMIFSRRDQPRLWATFEDAFTRVWDQAVPLPGP